jgi:ankyrin repeat protein
MMKSPTIILPMVALALFVLVYCNSVATAGSDPNKTIEEGRAAIGNGKYKEAMHLLAPLAKRGIPEAQNSVGVLYKEGWGVERDYTEAIKWFRAASDQGHAKAQYNLGRMYDEGSGVTKNFNKAVGWYRISADQGYPLAQSILGAMYATGDGVLQDYAEALKWYRLAAEKGESEAQRRIGLMYWEGQGVEKNHEEALKWYWKAASSGNQVAINFLKETGNKYSTETNSPPRRESAGSTGQNRELLQAAAKGNTSLVESLISSGADINSRDDLGATPLFLAAVKGHTETVVLLIQNGAEIDARNQHGITPLFPAAGRGHLSLVQILVKSGANVNAVSENLNHTPIFSSVNVEIAKALMEGGAEINIRDKLGQSPLIRAAMNGRSDIVVFFLNTGEIVLKEGEAGKLFKVGATGCLTPNSVDRIMEFGIDEKEIKAAFFNAIMGPDGCLELVKHFIELGVDKDSQTEAGITGLMLAATWRHLDIVEFLLNQGADTKLKDRNGDTALDYAATREIAKLIKTNMKKR